MDASQHMLDPQWEPATYPRKEWQLIEMRDQSFYADPMDLVVKQLTVIVPHGTETSDHRYSKLCTQLELDSPFPLLEHLNFLAKPMFVRRCAKVPRLLLATAPNLGRVNTVTFSQVDLPLSTLLGFLKATSAHTLRFYRINVSNTDDCHIPTQLSVSSHVKFLDVRGVPTDLTGALLRGVLANKDTDDFSYARITVDPRDMVQSLWNSVGTNWRGCQILELASEKGELDSERCLAIFQSMKCNQDYRFSNVQEIRITRPKFLVEAYDAFMEYITEATHLLSIHIHGWTKVLDPHVRGAHWDMVCLMRALISVRLPVWFVFEDAPFDALVALSTRMAQIRVSLLILDVEQPADDWWPGEQEVGFCMLADNLVESGLSSTLLGAIEDNDKRTWATQDCNAGIWVGIHGNSLLNATDLTALRNACINNYEVRHARDLVNIRDIMHPGIGRGDEESDEDNEREELRRTRNATYISDRKSTDRVLHY